jgi:hypothetical protein
MHAGLGTTIDDACRVPCGCLAQYDCIPPPVIPHTALAGEPCTPNRVASSAPLVNPHHGGHRCGSVLVRALNGSLSLHSISLSGAARSSHLPTPSRLALHPMTFPHSCNLIELHALVPRADVEFGHETLPRHAAGARPSTPRPPTRVSVPACARFAGLGTLGFLLGSTMDQRMLRFVRHPCPMSLRVTPVIPHTVLAGEPCTPARVGSSAPLVNPHHGGRRCGSVLVRALNGSLSLHSSSLSGAARSSHLPTPSRLALHPMTFPQSCLLIQLRAHVPRVEDDEPGHETLPTHAARDPPTTVRPPTRVSVPACVRFAGLGALGFQLGSTMEQRKFRSVRLSCPM